MIFVENEWNIPQRDAEVPVTQLLFQKRGFPYPIDEENSALEMFSIRHDPFLFPDMNLACNRLREAREKGERILIYGDYDADGICATSILYLFFREIGMFCEYLIPDRLSDGYGISDSLFESIREKRIALVVTVDCGISNIDEIAQLSKMGLDVIVTDHHEPKEEIPNAVAVLDAKRKDSSYPFSQLCGAGVAWKLVQALCAEGMSPDPDLWRSYVDLAALGTVADVVPLTDENRSIVVEGLDRIKHFPRPGIWALSEVTGKSGADITANTLSFTFVPHINAAGRMGSASRALELLISKKEESKALADFLFRENIRRQEIEAEIFREVIEKLESETERESGIYSGYGPFVVWGKSWHQGVIGIVASRLMERYRRSCIILTGQGDKPGVYRGSARAFGEDNILSAILYANDFTVSSGGHKKAAGLSVEENNLEAFSQKILEYGKKHMQEKVSHDTADEEIFPSEISLETVKKMQAMEPFGEGNREPVFFLRNGRILLVSTFGDKKHLRFKLSCEQEGQQYTFDTIFFRKAYMEKLFKSGNLVDILFTLSSSIWNNREKMSIILKDIHFSKTGKIIDDKPELLESLFSNRLPIRQMTPLVKTDWENLILSREDIKNTYLFFRASFREEAVFIDYRILAEYMKNTMGEKKVSPFAIARIIDIFEEAGLLRLYEKKDKRIAFRLLFSGEKVILENTYTYQRLLQEGGIRT